MPSATPCLSQRASAALLLTTLFVLSCGRIEISPIPDLPAPEATCSGSDCSCPPGSHLLAEVSTECELCPFGTVNADTSATSCESSQVVGGDRHTCVLLSTGRVRCWGNSSWGQLGYGNIDQIGDDEAPSDPGDVELGGRAIQLAAGSSHTCALLDGGEVLCWGNGLGGRLGQGDEENIGDDELPIDRPPIDLGGPAFQIAAGGSHSCALLEGGRVRCWGSNDLGQLGNGDDQSIGDNEPVRSGLDVDLDGVAREVTLGQLNGCALLETGRARCWGILDFREVTPEAAVRSPAEEGDLPLPGPIEQISLGGYSTCALLSGGAVRCWGEQSAGELGNPGKSTVEIQEATDVRLGGIAVEVRTSEHHTCALLTKGNVRCWGGIPIGYPEFWPDQVDLTPEELGDVDVGGVVTTLAAGLMHTCSLLHTGSVRCWGFAEGVSPVGGDTSSGGWLGYANAEDIGDDETPASAGDVPYL